MKCCRLSLKLQILNPSSICSFYSLNITQVVFFQRVPGYGLHFEKLEVFLDEKFLPILTGLVVTHNDCVLYGLPTRDGFLGVLHPTEMCNLYYNVSRSCYDVIVQALKGL